MKQIFIELQKKISNYSYFIERKTLAGGSVPPDAPSFAWEQLPSENGYANIKVNWLPNTQNQKGGSHFYAKYREKGQTTWLNTGNELDNDFVVIRGLDPDKTYEIVAVSVDGTFEEESRPQDVYTSASGNISNNIYIKIDRN